MFNGTVKTSTLTVRSSERYRVQRLFLSKGELAVHRCHAMAQIPVKTLNLP